MPQFFQIICISQLLLVPLQDLIREHNLTEKQVPIREPDLLIVLTGGKVGLRRKDGVYVIPIGCLKD